MGKFVYAVMTAFFVEAAIFLFGGSTYSNSTLFGLIMNPTNIVSTAVYTLIFTALIVFGASTIIPGNFFQINIYALFAGMAVSLITFVISFAHLWGFVYGELSSIFPTDLIFAQVITSAVVSPLAVFYLLAISEWVRGN